MAVFKIRANNLSCPSFEGVVRWCIDTPTQTSTYNEKDLSGLGFRISGWLLSDETAPIQLVVIDGSNIIELVRDNPRPDVIRALTQQEPDSHPQLLNGFDKIITVENDYFQVGILRSGRYVPLAEFFIENTLKVLKGENNWLFLDNDSNNSVEQFTGRLKISKVQLNHWKEYFRCLEEIGQIQDIPINTLIAPSKEMVFSEYYPFKKGKITPVEQLMRIAPRSVQLIIPINELKNAEQRSFRVCDTHWSHFGAFIATLSVAKGLKENEIDIKHIFQNDIYKTGNASGDLGSKVFPIQSHEELFLTSYSYKSHLVYDNQLPNFGRLMVFHDENALLNKTLLIFGSSSAYSMFNYIIRIYKSVVFFHSAGSIDRVAIDLVKPDAILTQTNARFVVKAPSIEQSMPNYIELKKKVLRSEDIKKPLINFEILKSREVLTDLLRRILTHVKCSSSSLDFHGK